MPKPDNFPHVALGLNARLEEQKNPETGDLLAKRIRKIGLIKEDGISRLEKYEELDKNHPLNRPFTGNPSFRGPVCTRNNLNIVYFSS